MASTVYYNNKVSVKTNGKESEHFKIWGYDVFENGDGSCEVVFYHGKILKPMDLLNKTKKKFPSKWEAEAFISKKVDEKLRRKGYRGIPNHEYWDAVTNEDPDALAKLFEIYDDLRI